MEPAKRLGSEVEGKARLDSIAAIYAQRAGISLAQGGDAGVGCASAGGAIMNSEEFLKFQAEQQQFAEQLNVAYLSLSGSSVLWCLRAISKGCFTCAN
ncbi:hypothetical protein EW146_g8637 [Bondarzewia mesenterica]|uniref:Uncharacterized protein n=1 Tax=Bondarzewia mesenterica TaxID=1095465 RepID=A0A4S4LCV7_9AGAM|nr:hypothetical protein EW146_g8637 [Bondarzewia mesenterica]